MDVVFHVLPFKTNAYVCEQLIRWDDVPDDPIFQLTFPQQGMLAPDDFNAIADLVPAGRARGRDRPPRSIASSAG